MKRFVCILLCMLLALPLAAQMDEATLEELLAEYVAEDDPGVVLLVSYEGETWIGARGLADLENGTPVQTDDLFRIGSTTKPFVAVLMLQLVEEGEIGLDDPIVDYLPEDVVANIANAQTATIRQMLNMTSGIYNYTESDDFNDLVEADFSRAWTAAETVATVYGYDAYFAPGADFYYSNTNYNLAQMIIEDVWGEPLADALQEGIFDPLGMESCFLETPDRFAEGIVRGYAFYGPGDYEDITEINDGVGMGDGGIVCNATDLAKFMPGLLGGDLLEDETLAAMLETVPDDGGAAYGLGIGVEDGEFGMQIGHDGSTSGFNANMVYLEDEAMVVVLLTNNFDSEIVGDLTTDAQAVALGEF